MAVVNGYAFMAYCRENYSEVSFNDSFVNKESGELFTAVIGTLKAPRKDPTTGEEQKYEFIHPSSKIEGGLTEADIIRDKDVLRVVRVDSGGLVLCYPGESSWRKLDLGL